MDTHWNVFIFLDLTNFDGNNPPSQLKVLLSYVFSFLSSSFLAREGRHGGLILQHFPKTDLDNIR